MAGRLFEAKNAQNPKIYQVIEKIVYVKAEFFFQSEEVLLDQIVQLLNTPEEKRTDGFEDILVEVKYVEAIVFSPLADRIPILLENIQEISAKKEESVLESMVRCVNPHFRFIDKTKHLVSDELNSTERIVNRL